MAVPEDGFHHLGREEAEPQDLGEVGPTDACLFGKLRHGPAPAVHHHFVEAMRLAQQSEQAAIRGYSCVAVLSFDHDPGLHSRALEMRRNREGYGQFVIPQSWLKVFSVVLLPKNLQQPARCNPDFQ